MKSKSHYFEIVQHVVLLGENLAGPLHGDLFVAELSAE